MDGDNIAVLDTEVVARHTGEAGTALVEIVVGEDNQDGVLPLLAADEDSIAAEQLQGVHGARREHNDGVIVINRVGDAEKLVSLRVHKSPISAVLGYFSRCTYRSWLGFFFLFRIAVAVSSSFGGG